MNPREKYDLLFRWRMAAVAIIEHERVGMFMADQFGLTHLGHFLVENIRRDLRLRDAYDDLQAKVIELLNEEDILFFDHGYYKLGPLGFPVFYPGSPVPEAQNHDDV